MSIINYKYGKIINNCIKNVFSEEFELKTVNNYLDFINYLDGLLLEIIKKSIINSFESIDLKFKNSILRKQLYYTKGLYPRTIMTLFGEITFEREYYVPKGYCTDGFYYVDKLFNLPKRDYYDPMIKALIIEKSSQFSYIQSGSIVGDMIGTKFKNMTDSLYSQISRQTVYNVIKHADMDFLYEDTKSDVETLYIQFDEKWVYTQNTNHQMKEIKAAVIYTGIKEEYKGRNKLINRHVITSDVSAFNIRQKVLDYVNNTYNVDKITNVVVSGDGASWIKNSVDPFKFTKETKTMFVLDRFHMHQAINHISKDDDIKYYLRHYIKYGMRKSFTETCNALIAEYPLRQEIISKNRDYIVNNWFVIKNQSHPLFLGCSMEGHISHILAAPFSSRPKAHSLHMLSKRLIIREAYVNNQDTKQVYLNNHVDPIPEVNYVDSNTRYPTSVLDVIGHKVTQKYKYFKRAAHSTIFS
jgi:hypothetical protein